MTLSPDSFLGSRGFSENPFILTNADEEQNLSSYFVPPPFFDAVLGQAAEPKSCTVFAPRGGGKPAQKVMIEATSRVSSNDASFLCLTYDRFILPDKFSPKSASLDWHLLNIVRILTASLLVDIEEHDKQGLLDQEEKDFLVKTARNYLFDINLSEFQNLIYSMRNWQGHAEDIFKKYGGQIANLLTAIAARFDLGKIEALGGTVDNTRATLIVYFERLISVAQKLGYRAVYILVDRVDETSVTQNDANSSFEFIQSLLLDLHVLETKGCAFKFFLWDQVRSKYISAGGRTDRIPLYSLNWNFNEMSTMLSERLKAYSEGKVKSMSELLADDDGFDLHSLVTILAFGSPRDMIRLCKAIVDEKTRVKNEPGILERRFVNQGISTFSDQRSLELFGGLMEDLRKVGLASFTISMLANDIFRVTANAISRKIQIWTDQGAVVRSGEVPNPGARPQNLYSLSDPRLCFSVKSQYITDAILESNLFICPSCDAINIYEQEDVTSCRHCQSPIDDDCNVLYIVDSSKRF